jgi:hypothetical protein
MLLKCNEVFKNEIQTVVNAESISGEIVAVMDKADLTTLGHDLLKGEKALDVSKSEAQTKYIMFEI